MADDDDHAATQSDWPTQLRCKQCQQEIPADEALHPEGQDYTLAFCSPECYALWSEEQADPVVASHRQRSGRH